MPKEFLKWREEGNFLISLAVQDKNELELLCDRLTNKNLSYIKFYEPDVDEITAIVITPSEEADKITSSIPLANRKSGIKNKHNK